MTPFFFEVDMLVGRSVDTSSIETCFAYDNRYNRELLNEDDVRSFLMQSRSRLTESMPWRGAGS